MYVTIHLDTTCLKVSILTEVLSALKLRYDNFT